MPEGPAAPAARSKLEAVVRLSGLTHRPPEGLGPGSKERKSVLLNLAADLDLPIDPKAAKPLLGEQVARQLGVHWDRTCWSAGSTVTLEGLNRILLGTMARLRAQREAPQLELFNLEPGAGSPFLPARSKLEAVTRISSLTGSPPEVLGPGSKERKSALANLAVGLGLDVNTGATKPALGSEIARALGVRWDQSCWSTGATITLKGLNQLLAGAEAAVASSGAAKRGLFYTAREEGLALLAALRNGLPEDWDGRQCIDEMRLSEYSQWAQDEWAAFYFEFVGLPALVNTFGGGPRMYANTRFDYALAHTWDLKVHMAATGVAPLNDCGAVDAALAAGTGLGFLVLTGDVDYDQGEFRTWQRAYRLAHGKTSKPRKSAPKYVRRSKRGFRPRMLEAFYFADAESRDEAIASDVLRVMRQGAQTSGHPRAPKYSLDLLKARLDGRVLLSQVIL